MRSARLGLACALLGAASVGLPVDRPCPREPVKHWANCVAVRGGSGAFGELQGASRAIVKEDGVEAVHSTDFEAIVKNAGLAYKPADTERLAAALRSRELGELLFALSATHDALEELREGRPGTGTKSARIARWKALARTARPTCTAAAASERSDLRRLGRECLDRLDEPDPLFFETRRSPKPGDRGLLAALGRGEDLSFVVFDDPEDLGVHGPHGLGSGPAGSGGRADDQRLQTCLRNAIPWVELCLSETRDPARHASRADLLLRKTPRERDSISTTPYWIEIDATDARDHVVLGQIAIPLETGETVGKRKVAVFADGESHVISVPIIKGWGPNHRRARVVLVPFEGDSRKVGEPWRSPTCAGACKLPRITVAGAASELEVSLERLEEAGGSLELAVESVRLRSESGRLVPANTP